MKLKIWIFAAVLALTTLARGATNDLTDLLQKGLFEEEANRDLNAAIANYQSLANAFDKDRQLAATAVFRLGECYRKLGKTNEAAAQYQRILKDFSDQQTLATLSRQNLGGLNVAAEPANSGADDSSLVDAQANAASLQAQLQVIEKMPRNQCRIYVEQNFPNPVMTDLVRQLDLAQQDLIRLKVDYTPDHPKYKIAQELADNLNRKVEAQVDAVIEGLRTKLAIAQTQVDLLRNQQGGPSGSRQSDVLLRLQIQRSQEGIAEYQKQQQELLKTYEPTNPRVVQLTQQIDAEKATLAELNAKLQAAQGAGEGANVVTDEEQQEIRRIQAMIQNSPDLINAGSGGVTPLTTAALRGQLLVAKYLLDHGADVNGGSGPHTVVPLSAAAESGQKAMVELLLSRGADVNGGGLSPLYDAVQKGYTGVAEVLLANHADVNLPSGTYSGGLRPIQVAARDGRTEMVKLLIQYGADVNVADPRGETALEYAAENNNTNAVKLLLAAKAAVESKDKDGNTSLHEAAERGNTAIVSLLLDSGATVDATNSHDATPLLLAVANGRVDASRVLLEHKADPEHRGVLPSWRPYTWFNQQDWNKQPITFAIMITNTEILKLVLDAGANPEGDSSPVEMSPLFYAIDKNYVDGVQLLLQHGANANRPNTNGIPPLTMVMLYRRDKRMVPLLLDKGANPNAESRQYYSPIFYTSDPEIGRWLIEHKANVNLQSSRGWTALMNARDTNFIRFLLENGAKTDLQETNGNTALHYAAGIFSSPEEVALLLEHKANPNIQNEVGNTPLDIAKAGISGQIPYTLLDAQSGGVPPAPAKVSPDNEQRIAELLTQAGGLANLPRRNRIEVRRAPNYSNDFGKGGHDWNRYSLLEILGSSYGLLSRNTWGDWRGSQGTKNGLFGGSLRFPDFKNVVIYRRTDASAKQKAINVNLDEILNTGDCSRDMWLEWGDVIEIPEADHPVEERWPGLTDKQITSLTNCLTRRVTVRIKGEDTVLTLAPTTYQTANLGSYGDIVWSLTPASFMVRSVLDNSKLLRVSSDLSRVKVTRVDPDTKKKQEWVIDCTKWNDADLWLRDGDVVEVPEK